MRGPRGYRAVRETAEEFVACDEPGLSRRGLISNEVAPIRSLDTERKTSMGIIAWIVVGAIAGFIASFIMGTRDGILMTIALGIVGAVVGGFLAGALLDLKEPTGINVETIVVSVIGAIIVVFVANLLTGSRRGRGTV